MKSIKLGKTWTVKIKRKILSNKYNKNKITQGQKPIFCPSVSTNHWLWTGYMSEKRIREHAVPVERSKYLLDKIKEHCKISKTDSVLEVGCSVGRNLNYLYENEFSNLYGIEINERAIEIMHELYPKLTAKVLVGPVEKQIKEIKDNEISITFSMAVLMHINPQSHFIFREISRITKDYIITIENEKEYSPPSLFVRDYGKIFSELGWKQIHEEPGGIKGLGPEMYVVRIFKK